MFFLALPFYLRRMLRRGGYGASWEHRFGLLPVLSPNTPKTRIWIQAVSVGELLAVCPLALRLKNEGMEVILTVTTSTAYKLAVERLSSQIDVIAYFPLDFWPFSALAWRRLRPDLALMMESELWPEHLAQAQRRDVPVLLINARLSDRSFSRYKKLMPVARTLAFDPLTLILAGTPQDEARFKALGVATGKITYIGHLKCDMPMDPYLDEKRKRALIKELFPDADGSSLILLGSSTWPGEEAFLVDLQSKVRSAGMDVRLLLAPRHAERREEVTRILEEQPLPWTRRSDGKSHGENARIYLADTTGELRMLTQLADVAFIGKSLPPHNEGQSPIEAVAYGVPAVMGPGMSNFRDITESLVEVGAAVRARDAVAVRESLLDLLRSSDRRRTISQQALEWHASQRGATDRAISAIKSSLAKAGPAKV